jgi:hypothetical protein
MSMTSLSESWHEHRRIDRFKIFLSLTFLGLDKLIRLDSNASDSVGHEPSENKR